MAGLQGWNISALFYAKTYGPLAHQLDDELFAYLGASLRGAVVADCGCGPGVVSEKLAARGAARVFAIDVSPQMLKQVPTLPQIKTIQAVVEDGVLRRLKETEASAGFDLILFKRSLYQDKPQALRVLRDAFECLRPGGRIVVIHPEGALLRYAFGAPMRLQRHSLYHLFNRSISLFGVVTGLEKYALYTRAELLSLAREVAGGQLEEPASQQQAFNLVAICKPREEA
jgi:2-polyprenyl-3-methyl-5-hydroxy-6-metoxy-1,4-benzoquinol methylase